MSAFNDKRFLSFLDLTNGSARAKLYLTIFKGIGLGVILYLILRPQYKTTQNSNPEVKGENQNITYNTYQNSFPERNKWISINGGGENKYEIEFGYKF